MRRVALIAAAVLVGGSVALAAPAQALGGFARTEINWAGPECIAVTSAQRYSPRHAVTDSICSPIGSYVFTESNVWVGDLFGADPIMGAAGYIQCQVWLNGRLHRSDSAYRGDGTDVSCLMTRTS